MEGGKRRSLFVSCCATDPVITPVNNTSHAGGHSMSQRNWKESPVARNWSGTTAESPTRSNNSSKASQGELTLGDEMGDLESPHYVKRTAHIFQSQIITTHNSNPAPSPSYLKVARSVSGYSSLSYNSSQQSTEVRVCHKIHPASAPLPQPAPPLASPSLVGKVSNPNSLIIQRIQRLYGTNTPLSTANHSTETLIPIQRETEQSSPSSQQLSHSTPETIDLSKEEPVAMSPVKDGNYFLDQMDQEKDKIQKLIWAAEEELAKMEGESEEETGKIRAAIGKARLLLNKKFKQFQGLCETNLNEGLKGVGINEPFSTKNEDLAGFWDMVLIQVDHIHTIFAELDPNHTPQTKVSEDAVDKNSPPKSRPKNPGKTKATKPTTVSSTADANRRKLLAEKRKAMKALNHNGNADSALDIQILSSMPQKED